MSVEHLHTIHECKSSKIKYQVLISELDHLGYVSHYSTIEISCLDHYLSDSIKALQAIIQ